MAPVDLLEIEALRSICLLHQGRLASASREAIISAEMITEMAHQAERLGVNPRKAARCAARKAVELLDAAAVAKSVEGKELFAQSLRKSSAEIRRRARAIGFAL